MSTGDVTSSERLTRLETEVEGMRQYFTAQFVALSGKIDHLSDAIGEARKPRWDTWAAWLALGVTICGGGMWAVNQRFEAVEGRTERNYQMIAQLNTSHASFLEKLGEVETQFRTGSQMYNQTDYRHDLLLDQLWRKSFQQSLREDTPWPSLGKER